MMANHMRRTSYLTELDFYYNYALHCKTFVATHGTPFYNLINEYIEGFVDKEDVIEDIKPYLKLISSEEDIQEMKERI